MTDQTHRITVWDWPVRVFHWGLAASVFVAYVTGESERWRLLHQSLGYVALGLLAFRLLWGVLGTRHARFVQFVHGPKAVLAYIQGIRQGKPSHHAGHNPIGGVAVLLLMLMTALTGLSGWLMAGGDAPGWQEEWHEVMANTLMLLIGVHVMGVLFSSRVHRENLVKAMVDGVKQGLPEDGIQYTWGWLAVLMVVTISGFMFSQFWV
jgi:cytochrome b